MRIVDRLENAEYASLVSGRIKCPKARGHPWRHRTVETARRSDVMDIGVEGWRVWARFAIQMKALALCPIG